MKSKSSFNYVCPGCFERVNKCKCNKAPDYLIQIDYKLQDTIKELNNLGYITQACCEGHYTKGVEIVPYILFVNRPDTKPEGWAIRGSGIYCYINVNSKNEFKVAQDCAINALINWTKTLDKFKI